MPRHELVDKSWKILESADPDDDGLVGVGDAEALDVRVSPKLVQRACRVMDALLEKLGDSGIDVTVADGRTAAIADGVAVPLRLREQVSKLRTVSSRESPAPWRHKQLELEPSGELALAAFGPAGQRHEWSDADRDLLLQLDDVVVRVLALAAQWRRLADRPNPSDDTSRIQELRAAVQAWREAEHIRSFVKAARRKGRSDDEWLRWAESYADRLDPLSE